MKLRETFIKRLKEIKGNAVGFRIDQIRLPNGKTATREYLNHPGAVAAVALIRKNTVLMVKQFRHPVKQCTWEIPAGKLAKGENPLACVNRELEEETGYRATKITKMILFWPTATFANEVLHIYLAENLVKGKLNPDEDEFLTCTPWPLSKLMNDIRRGKIKDAKTLIGLLTYITFYR